MEVSAHALYYDKIYGLNFEVGIFTNCTQDHLDFFGNCAVLYYLGNIPVRIVLCARKTEE